MILGKIAKDWITLEDFGFVYDEYQDETLKFIPISESNFDHQTGENNKVPPALVDAIRTFDHQGTGFISLNELKFSNNLYK